MSINIPDRYNLRLRLEQMLCKTESSDLKYYKSTARIFRVRLNDIKLKTKSIPLFSWYFSTASVSVISHFIETTNLLSEAAKLWFSRQSIVIYRMC